MQEQDNVQRDDSTPNSPFKQRGGAPHANGAQGLSTGGGATLSPNVFRSVRFVRQSN